MGISTSGNALAAKALPVDASKMQDLTEELPRSIPKSNRRMLPEDGIKCSDNPYN
jgi:hypothetical protein